MKIKLCAIITEQWLQNTVAKYILVQKALSCVAFSANALNFLKICKYSTNYRNDENIRYSKANWIEEETISVKTAAEGKIRAGYQIKGFVILDDK